MYRLYQAEKGQGKNIEEFQYISCIGYTLFPYLLPVIGADFNTSHVSVILKIIAKSIFKYFISIHLMYRLYI